MNSLLEQFLPEARECLQSIGENLMQLEREPDNAEYMINLFRRVHTLKGNSSLFDFPEMTRVLHAGEDLMEVVRNGSVAYSQALADQLLDAMDFVGLLCDDVEATERIDSSRIADSTRLAASLRTFMHQHWEGETALAGEPLQSLNAAQSLPPTAANLPEGVGQLIVSADLPLALIPDAIRLNACAAAMDGQPLYWLDYRPQEECFFQGDDPFFTARQAPGFLWGRVVAREVWPAISELDAYRCVLDFQLLCAAPDSELSAHFRYVPEQLTRVAVEAQHLVILQGNPNGGPVYDDFVADALKHLDAGDNAALRQAAHTMLHLSNPDLWLSSALRWLLLMLEKAPAQKPVLRSLIESLLTLTPPKWSANLMTQTAPEVAIKTVLSATFKNQQDCNQDLDQACAHGSAATPTSSFSHDQEASPIGEIFRFQRQILLLNDGAAWQAGRVKAVASVLINCSRASGDGLAAQEIPIALAAALANGSNTRMLEWLENRLGRLPTNFYAAHSTAVPVPVLTDHFDLQAAHKVECDPIRNPIPTQIAALPLPVAADETAPISPLLATPEALGADDAPQHNRRADNGPARSFNRRSDDLGPKSLKVEQSKIDLLMNLIGEMVVSKNALPYLAQRAEEQFGVRELAREIKAQYAVINRIAEEMQSAIMQVRMMPVSSVFQRFPRLVRDISRKLGKEVELVLEGEETEADKNIIESLADPLMHIVRNSLDHGLELPEVRRAAGKPALGRLTIRAAQEGDQVLIEISDDGKGINPAIIKRKAFEKGLIDAKALERISDREAINLVFAAGFSTAEVVSDLSGRGVGMDVVRTAVEKVNGTLMLESVVGEGTHIRIALPLSMAVTKVMIIESDSQIFGVPMEHVVETVRVPCSSIRSIKRNQTIVRRGKVVPLKSLNTLLAIAADPLANADREMAVLVVRVGAEAMGLIVDDFHETVDVIQKPLSGVLAGLAAYSGSALMGNGSVLMVLNVKEIV